MGGKQPSEEAISGKDQGGSFRLISVGECRSVNYAAGVEIGG